VYFRSCIDCSIVVLISHIVGVLGISTGPWVQSVMGFVYGFSLRFYHLRAHAKQRSTLCFMVLFWIGVFGLIVFWGITGPLWILGKVIDYVFLTIYYVLKYFVAYPCVQLCCVIKIPCTGRLWGYEPGLHLCVELDQFRRGFLWENIHHVV
jgi:hypothetical protein